MGGEHGFAEAEKEPEAPLTHFDAQATQTADEAVHLAQRHHGLHAKDKELAIIEGLPGG